MIERATGTVTRRAAKMKIMGVEMAITSLLALVGPRVEDDGARPVVVKWTGVGRLHSVSSPEMMWIRIPYRD